jgi:hypothetical protein
MRSVCADKKAALKKQSPIKQRQTRALPLRRTLVSLRFVIKAFGTNAQPASRDAEQMGFGHSPTSILNLDFEKSDSKIASWYQLALLAA